MSVKLRQDVSVGHTEWPNWSAKTVEGMRAARQARGWSAGRLAAEVTAVGVPWTRSVVTNLETGRRTFVTVDELMALAVVFGDMSPLDLVEGADSVRRRAAMHDRIRREALAEKLIAQADRLRADDAE